MEPVFEILEHIFSFLVLHRDTLIACSKDPGLSPFVQRHLYYHLTVDIGGSESTDPKYTFTPERLSKLVSEKPHILSYVRILQLQIEFPRDFTGWPSKPIIPLYRERLDKFAETLIMFPSLNSIMLTSKNLQWCWSEVFRDALEDRLRLPTVTEAHFIGSDDFPFSILGNCENISDLSLSGSFVGEGPTGVSTLPQLKSLTLFTDQIYSSSLLDWLKLHIEDLESLKCNTASINLLPELLGVCSETLNKLDVDLSSEKIGPMHFPDFCPISLNLQQLILRTAVHLEYYKDQTPQCCISSLTAAAVAINMVTPSPRHLVLDITLNLTTFSELSRVDFSPLAVLGAGSASIPRIDLYVHTGNLPSAVTRAHLLSSLEDFEDVTRLIEDGRLTIHSERSYPESA